MTLHGSVPPRLRRRLVLLALLVIGAGAGGAAATAADRHPRSAGMPSYEIARSDQGAPVRWAPCRPLRYVLDATLAPSAAAVADVHAAAAHLAQVTGRPLVHAGATVVEPRKVAIPAGADIVVAWLRPSTTHLPLEGTAGVSWQRVRTSGGRLEYDGGVVALNAEAKMPTGRSERATWFSVALHEFAHDYGLGHVATPGEIMGPGPYRPDGLGPGDRAGLALLGDGSRCGRTGYWMVDGAGTVHAFGDAAWFGDAGADAVDIEGTPSGRGYWTTDGSGGVRAFGEARYLGGSPALRPTERVTSMSRTPSGAGYWLFTSAGRVLAYGDAPFLGDMSATALNGPVLDSVPTPSGRGYYLVAADGGVFCFGDARFAGSTAQIRLNSPVQSLVPDTDGRGYWLVAGDGGVFAFDASFVGSTGNLRLNRPVTGMVGSRSGRGYLMVGEDGGIFSFGDAPFRGSLGGDPPAAPVVAVASLT